MDEDQVFEDLILKGALEPCGIDIETGDMLYNFTDKLKTISPELHNEFSRYFSTEVYALWEEGFLDMNVTENNPSVYITPKALNADEIKKLDRDKQYTLKEIIRLMLNKGKK